VNRRPPPNPAAVEAALPPDFRALLPMLEDAHGCPRGRWWALPSLALTVEAVAVAQVRAQLEARGMARTRAIERAALRLGLGADFGRTLRRWRKKALRN